MDSSNASPPDVSHADNEILVVGGVPSSNTSPPDVSPADNEILVVSGVPTDPAFTTTRYKFERVTMDCTQIKAPPNPSRLPTPSHVEGLMEGMLTTGFSAVFSTIFVVPNPDTLHDSTAHSHVCVDGLHRLSALQRLSARPEQSSLFLHVPVVVLRRPDNSPILGFEILQLSAHFNKICHLVSPLTYTDKISFCGSIIKELSYTTATSDASANCCLLRDKDSNYVTQDKMVKVLDDTRLLPDKKATIRRILQAHLAVVGFPDVWKALLTSCQGPHGDKPFPHALLADATFGKSDPEVKILSIQAFAFRYERMATASQRGFTIDHPGPFFRCVKRLYDISVTIARSFGLCHELLHRTTLEHGAFEFLGDFAKGVDHTVSTYILSLLSEWRSMNDDDAISLSDELCGKLTTVVRPVASKLAEEKGIAIHPSPLNDNADDILNETPATIDTGDPQPEQFSVERQAISHSVDGTDALEEDVVPPDVTPTRRPAGQQGRSSARLLAVNVPPSPPAPPNTIKRTLVRSGKRAPRKRRRTGVKRTRGRSRTVGIRDDPRDEADEDDNDDDEVGESESESDSENESAGEGDLFDDVQENPAPDGVDSESVASLLPSVLSIESRARFHLTAEDIHTIRREVSNKSRMSLHYPAGTPVENFLSHASTETLAAIQSAMYFEKAATELKGVGYVIMDGFLEGTKAGEKLCDLLRFFHDRYSGPDSPRSANDPWTPIVNASATGAPEVSGRLTVSRRLFCDDLERNYAPHAHHKLYIETTIGHIVDQLGIDRMNPGVGKLQSPKTGSRLLMTVEGCKRQLPHLDYPPLPTTSEPFLVRAEESYFVMLSGEDPFVIVLWPYTHAMMNCSPATKRELSRKWPSKVVHVPKLSTLIMRGDVVHAGAGSADDEERGDSTRAYKYNIRLHMYIVREGTPLLDAVHLPDDFNFK
jgi:hypothetical protein